MNKQQKIAWFRLIVILLSLGLSITAFSIGYFIFGVSARQAASGFGFIGLFGFLGLTPFLFVKDKRKNPFDERDLAIARKSSIVAYSVFWLLFTAASIVPWFILGQNGMITVNYLTWMLLGGWMLVWGVQSIVILNEYGWRSKGD
jgi:hypothetical protein